MATIELVYVFDDSCACDVGMRDVLQELQANYSQYCVVSINARVEQAKANKLMEDYELDAIPSLLLFLDQNFVGSVHGFQPYEIVTLWIEDRIEKHMNNN